MASNTKIKLGLLVISLYFLWDLLMGKKASDLSIPESANMPTTSFKARGLRNNNPLNLRFSSVAWLNKIPKAQNTDVNQKTGAKAEFEQFTTMEAGIRAGIQNAITAVTKHKCDTVRKLIYRWAPPTENRSADYVAFVCKRAGVSPDYKIDLTNQFTMCKIIFGMIQQECGIDEVAAAGITSDTVSDVMTKYAMLPRAGGTDRIAALANGK